MTLKKGLIHYWQIYVLMSAGIVCYLLFRILPLWGLSVAFVDYSVVGGLLKSPFVGLKYFFNLMADPRFFRMLRNTVAISVINLVFAFPAPILLAMVFNELRHKHFQRLSQTIVYMPHFLSWPVVFGLTFSLFSVDIGIVNKIILAMGIEPIRFLSDPNTFWFVLLFQNIWREIGWGTIVYLAAISQIDMALYEAATVDGATRMQKMTRITIPCLMPTIIVMFLMRLGRFLDVSFEQVLLMTNNYVTPVSEIFDTYAYRVGVQNGNYSVGSAVGFFKSAVSLLLVLGSNWAIKKTGNEGLF
ncbi:protein LplB [Spirochaetia bacterium]|nr:protein LplB [Spirochaetia bacterium]